MAGHVYHWRHGWIPLDHTSALSKAKGNHERAGKLLADAHSDRAGIHTRQDVAKATLDLPNIADHTDRMAAKADIIEAAGRLNAHDSIPAAWRNTPVRHGSMSIGDAEKISMAHRLDPNSPKIKALTEHIKKHGVQEPIQVEETNKGPFIGDGHHRIMAARLAGLTKIPTITYANTPEGRLAANKAMNGR